MTFNEKINVLLGLPKSLYYNLKWFGIKEGIKLPALIGRKCIIRTCQDSKISIAPNAQTGDIKIGINQGPFLKGKGEYSYFNLAHNAEIRFKGKCNINAGSIINISGGLCEFGNRFAANAHFLLSCEKEIRIGDDVLFGWDCTVIDGDGHTIVSNIDNEKCNQPKVIEIGEHVWIGAKSTILKGTRVSDNSIIAYGSVLTKDNMISNVILGGNPAHILKEGVNWIR